MEDDFTIEKFQELLKEYVATRVMEVPEIKKVIEDVAMIKESLGGNDDIKMKIEELKVEKEKELAELASSLASNTEYTRVIREKEKENQNILLKIEENNKSLEVIREKLQSNPHDKEDLNEKKQKLIQDLVELNVELKNSLIRGGSRHLKNNSKSKWTAERSRGTRRSTWKGR